MEIKTESERLRGSGTPRARAGRLLLIGKNTMLGTDPFTLKLRMKPYYRLIRCVESETVSIEMDYSFDQVSDPYAADQQGIVGNQFLTNFQFDSISGSEFADYLPNSVGLFIVSARVVQHFKKARNIRELEFIEMPPSAVKLSPRLGGYCLVGIKSLIKCLDLDKSEVRLSSSSNDQEVDIDVVYKCVLNAAKIPDECDIFRIKEYPGMIVVSKRIADLLLSLDLRGIEILLLES